MASILGIPSVKNKSHEIVVKSVSSGFTPIAGVAISINQNGEVMPFDSVNFYGFVVEYLKNSKNVSIVKAGLSVPVQAMPALFAGDNIFINNAGIVDSIGTQINGMIERINITAFNAGNGERITNCVLVSFGTGDIQNEVIPPILNDFNQDDFLSGDFA